MGARNENRLQRWERWALVAAAVTVLAQVAAVLVLDETAELVVVWSLWPVLLAGALATVPIDAARGSRRARFGLAIVAVTSGGFVVPQFSLPAHVDEADTAGIVWFGVAAVGVTIVLGVVGWAIIASRRRRYRQGPRRTVALRVGPASERDVSGYGSGT